jgi:hypothetical protein
MILYKTGGVSKEWWPVAIDRYQWPVDPASLETMDDHVYTLGRYHVFIRKLAVPEQQDDVAAAVLLSSR